jgi:hypothetical protein
LKAGWDHSLILAFTGNTLAQGLTDAVTLHNNAPEFNDSEASCIWALRLLTITRTSFQLIHECSDHGISHHERRMRTKANNPIKLAIKIMAHSDNVGMGEA